VNQYSNALRLFLPIEKQPNHFEKALTLEAASDEHEARRLDNAGSAKLR
jgi:hypothetical protein